MKHAAVPVSSGRLAEMQDSCKRERVRADSLERAVFCSFDYSGFFVVVSTLSI